LHLDRCLTCRNCETTCPSGVDYGHLIDIGRKLVDATVPRPAAETAVRWALKEGLPSPLFAPAMKVGQFVRGWLPATLKNKVPAAQPAGSWPLRTHLRKVLLLAGCVQPAMAPNINTATARVLDAAGIQTIVASKAGCCGAVKFHLNDQDGGKAQMRANIDVWWPLLDPDTSGDGALPVEAIVMNASGCGVTVKEYGHLLRDEPAYADKAARISALTKDLSELLPGIVESLQSALPGLADKLMATAPKLAFHPPCTLQHGQKLKGGVEQHLGALGFTVRTAATEANLCCGSAGTYSVLHPDVAYPLRDRKLGHLAQIQADVIVSANIGCITHLQSGTTTPVRHWVEVLDDALQAMRT
jgi:glycolate oxidase iron-sulfur subunit